MYRVFIAEPDTACRERLVEQVQKLDCALSEFDNGKDLWLALEQNTSACLVILNWKTPEIDGKSVVRLVKDRAEQFFSYVIMITDLELDSELVRAAFDAGVDDFLSKIADPILLEGRLRTANRVLKYGISLEIERRTYEKYSVHMEAVAQERANQLIEADRLVTLGTLSAGIAHEINNSTSFISGNTQTLKKFWPVVEEAAWSATGLDADIEQKLKYVLKETPDLLDGIMTGIARITKIVNGLRVYTHNHEAVELAPCDVAELIDHSLELTKSRTKTDVTVMVELDEELPQVNLDKVQVEQVLVNLIVNAAHAMEESELKNLYIRANASDDTLFIEVEDTGPGIPEDKLSRIWLPFFTTKEVGKGTGLGLHICRDIVKNHRGEIVVKSTPGEGAKFQLSFPMSGKEEEQTDVS